jgi:hypothetical protein
MEFRIEAWEVACAIDPNSLTPVGPARKSNQFVGSRLNQPQVIGSTRMH